MVVACFHCAETAADVAEYARDLCLCAFPDEADDVDATDSCDVYTPLHEQPALAYLGGL